MSAMYWHPGMIAGELKQPAGVKVSVILPFIFSSEVQGFNFARKIYLARADQVISSMISYY